MAITAATMVSAWVERKAIPSSSPLQSRKSPTVNRNRSPSAKRWSSGPMTMRTTPLNRNITPTEAIMNTTGFARCRR